MPSNSSHPPNSQSRSLHSLSRTCLIAPKLTGIVSLMFQFALLIVSALTAVFFFYHVGGYEYMGWNENSTILEPIYHAKNDVETLLQSNTTAGTPVLTSSDEMTTIVATTDNYRRIIDKRQVDEELLNSNGSEVQLNETISNGDFPTPSDATTMFAAYEDMFENGSLTGIEQVPNTTIYIGLVDAQLDMLELIRISTLVYIAICILWMVSMISLLFSIICEILDLVAINAVILTIAVMYAFVHALFIAVLLYYQRDMTWRTMAIVIGSVVILVGTAILGAVCLALCVGWYRYVSYMHTSNRCYCMRGIVRLIKGKKRSPSQAAASYSMTEQGNNYYRNGNAQQRQLDIPYADEPPIHQFSSF